MSAEDKELKELTDLADEAVEAVEQTIPHYLSIFPDGHTLTEPQFNALQWKRKETEVRSSLLNANATTPPKETE